METRQDGRRPRWQIAYREALKASGYHDMEDIKEFFRLGWMYCIANAPEAPETRQDGASAAGQREPVILEMTPRQGEPLKEWLGLALTRFALGGVTVGQVIESWMAFPPREVVQESQPATGAPVPEDFPAGCNPSSRGVQSDAAGAPSHHQPATAPAQSELAKLVTRLFRHARVTLSGSRALHISQETHAKIMELAADATAPATPRKGVLTCYVVIHPDHSAEALETGGWPPGKYEVREERKGAAPGEAHAG